MRKQHRQPMRAALAVLFLGSSLLAGCAPRPVSLPPAPAEQRSADVPGGTAPSPGTPEPSPAPVVSPATPPDGPRVPLGEMYALPVGPSSWYLGYTAPRAGGVFSLGPTSLAVDSEREIYVWDQARARVLVYGGSKLDGMIPLPFAPAGASQLLVYGGRIYLRLYQTRQGGIELVTDPRTGALQQISPFGPETLYPRGRPAPAAADLGKGNRFLGEDDLGNRYERTLGGVRRVSPDGQELAVADEPNKIQNPIDTFVAADGSVYSLSWYTDRDVIDNVKVVQLLPPAGQAKPERTEPAPPPPVVNGRPVPATVTVTGHSLPTVSLSDRDRQSLWAILAAARPDPQSPSPEPAERLLELTATWPTGQPMVIRVGGTPYATIDGAPYLIEGELVRSLVRYATASPEALLAAARQQGAKVAIADLPGVSRDLTPAQLDQLASALKGALPVRAAEIPLPVELPFPRYQIRMGAPGGPVVQVFDDQYLWVGDPDVWMEDQCGALLVPGGKLRQLLASWLPAPAAQPGDVAYLYQAEKLTLGDGADLTRRKISVVRALLGLWPTGGDFPDHTPIQLTFLVAGKPEVVTVTAEGFAYGGKTYERKNLLSLQGLQGMP